MHEVSRQAGFTDTELTSQIETYDLIDDLVDTDDLSFCGVKIVNPNNGDIDLDLARINEDMESPYTHRDFLRSTDYFVNLGTDYIVEIVERGNRGMLVFLDRDSDEEKSAFVRFSEVQSDWEKAAKIAAIAGFEKINEFTYNLKDKREISEKDRVTLDQEVCIYPIEADKEPQIKIEESRTVASCLKMAGEIGKIATEEEYFYTEFPRHNSDIMYIKLGKMTKSWLEVQYPGEGTDRYKFVKDSVLRVSNNNYKSTNGVG